MIEVEGVKTKNLYLESKNAGVLPFDRLLHNRICSITQLQALCTNLHSTVGRNPVLFLISVCNVAPGRFGKCFLPLLCNDFKSVDLVANAIECMRRFFCSKRG